LSASQYRVTTNFPNESALKIDNAKALILDVTVGNTVILFRDFELRERFLDE